MANTDIRLPGTKEPIARYIYLVNEVTDALRMGGTLEHAYTNFQLAYSAADTLQTVLGGTNKVVIMVGNTLAASVGNVILTANWNANVYLTGITREVSIVGTITSATTAFTVNSFFDEVTVGDITTVGGLINLRLKSCTVGNLNTTSTIANSGAVTLSGNDTTMGTVTTSSAFGNGGFITITGMNDSTIGVLNTSSTVTISGAVTLTLSTNLTIGNVTQDWFLGTSGVTTISSCVDIVTGAFSKVNLNPVGTHLIGNFVMSLSTGVVINASGGNSYTATMISATNVAGVAHFFTINQNCSGIVFNGTVNIRPYNVLSATSDLPVNIIAYNTIFNGRFLVNATTGLGVANTGGYISGLEIHNCEFGGGSVSPSRFFNNTTTAKATTVFYLTDCMLSGTNANTIDIETYNTSYDLVYIKNITSARETSLLNFTTSGWAVSPINTMSATATAAIFKDITVDLIVGPYLNPLLGPSANLNDFLLSNITSNYFEFTVNDGDTNFRMTDSAIANEWIIDNLGTVPSASFSKISSFYNTSLLNDDGILNTNGAYLPMAFFSCDVILILNASEVVPTSFYNCYVQVASSGLPLGTLQGSAYTTTIDRISAGFGVTLDMSLYNSIDKGNILTRQISAVTTIDILDHIIEVTANTFTQPLPAIASAPAPGRELIFKNSGTGVLTLSAASIDFLGTLTVLGGTAVKLKDNGIQWIVID